MCAPAPFQAAGIVALGAPETYYVEMCAEYSARRALLLGALDAVGMPYRAPEGAYYVMADFGGLAWDGRAYARSDWTTDRAFAEYIAREIGVAVVPGSSFYAGRHRGTSRVRLNFAKRASTLREAAKRLRRVVPDRTL